MTNPKRKSGRDVLSIHSAADLLRPMSPEELRELADDIKKNGLLHGIELYIDYRAGTQYVLDGRNRLDAMELLGWDLLGRGGHRCRRAVAEAGSRNISKMARGIGRSKTGWATANQVAPSRKMSMLHPWRCRGTRA